jgi:hypothetical protein
LSSGVKGAIDSIHLVALHVQVEDTSSIGIQQLQKNLNFRTTNFFPDHFRLCLERRLLNYASVG